VGIFFAILTSTSRLPTAACAGSLTAASDSFGAMIPLRYSLLNRSRSIHIHGIVFASVWPIYVGQCQCAPSADRTLIETGRSFDAAVGVACSYTPAQRDAQELSQVSALRRHGGCWLPFWSRCWPGQRGLVIACSRQRSLYERQKMFGLVILCGFIGILLNYLLLSVSKFLTGWQLALSVAAELDGGATA